MGAAHDLLVDDVMLATAAPSSRGSGGLPTIKMCVCTQCPNMDFVSTPGGRVVVACSLRLPLPPTVAATARVRPAFSATGFECTDSPSGESTVSLGPVLHLSVWMLGRITDHNRTRTRALAGPAGWRWSGPAATAAPGRCCRSSCPRRSWWGPAAAGTATSQTTASQRATRGPSARPCSSCSQVPVFAVVNMPSSARSTGRQGNLPLLSRLGGSGRGGVRISTGSLQCDNA